MVKASLKLCEPRLLGRHHDSPIVCHSLLRHITAAGCRAGTALFIIFDALSYTLISHVMEHVLGSAQPSR